MYPKGGSFNRGGGLILKGYGLKQGQIAPKNIIYRCVDESEPYIIVGGLSTRGGEGIYVS